MEQFFNLFKTVPVSDYSEKTVEFLSAYFNNIAENIKARKAFHLKNDKGTPAHKIANEDNYELYDYDLLWNVVMAKHDQAVSPMLRNNSMNCLMKLIINDPATIETYIYKSIELITSNADSILYAMNYLKSILYESKKRDAYLNMLKVNYHILDKVLHSLIQYKQKANKLLEQANYKDSIMEQVYSLRNTIEPYFFPLALRLHQGLLRLY